MDLPFRQRQIRKVFVKKAAQIGVSEALRNILACLAHQEPDPALLVLPDENSAKKIMRKRILPMFEDTPALAALKTAQAKDQALHNVTLRNGFDLGIGWSGSPSTLAADPIRFIGFDETDKFSDWNGRESDPISLGDVRTATYDNAIQYAISTPTTREGLINALHENAAIKLWFFVPCPHCGLAQRLTFGQLEWDYKEVKDARQRAAMVQKHKAAWYRCFGCEEKILDAAKPKMVNHGFWATEDQSYRLHVDGREEGQLPAGSEVGMHISALYSLAPKHRFYEIAAEWIMCSGNPMRTQGFRNSWLGEVFEQLVLKPKASLIRDKVAGDETRNIPPAPPPKIIPAWAGVLIATADTQKDHFCFVIRAWGAEYRSQLVHYGIAQTFDELKAVCLDTGYRFGDGAPVMPRALLIDSGGTSTNGVSRTSEVYEFAMRDQQRIVPTKGASQAMSSPWRESKVGDAGLILRLIDTGYYKDMLSRLLNDPDATKWMPHAAVDDDYCKQMASEHKVIVNGKQVWVPVVSGGANHFWDCEVLQCAAADMAHVALMPVMASAPAVGIVAEPQAEQPQQTAWAAGYKGRW